MRKNVASQVVGAQMVSASDGSPFTGSVTCYVTVDAGTQAVGSVSSGACTHEGGGYHTYAPAQAETNGDLVAFQFRGTGAISATVQVYTVGYDPTQAVVPADVQSFGGTAWGTVLAALADSVWAVSARTLTSISDSSGVTTLLSRLSSARAGYLDNLSAGAVALESSLQGLITTVSGLASAAATAVWSAGTRLLTAGTNIVLAKGTGVTGFTDLDAAGVRTAVGLASANLDTQLGAIDSAVDGVASDLATVDSNVDAILEDTGTTIPGTLTTIDTVVDGIKVVTDNLPDSGALTALVSDAADAVAASEDALDRLPADPLTTGSVVDDESNTASAFETNLTATADGHWVGAYLRLTSGALAGQVRRITGYNGTTKFVTAEAFTDEPEGDVTFAIVNR